ncbi:MAG TPA: response regulator [Kofleriaceae bacterium]|nr:response regulator [Kofleriaceae bacterium]
MSNNDKPGSTGEQPTPEELLGIGAGEDILIVDDNEANLIAFDSALAPLGRRLVMVQSGVQALAEMLAQDFALVILDVSMPGMTGIECAEMIRKRKRTRGIPIIFVTGLTVQDTAILEGYDAGGFDFVVKPVRAEVLRAKVRVFLQLQERTRAMQHHAAARHELEIAANKAKLREQEQRHESEMLEMRVQQLAEMDRRKDELLAILGHQLRNPLQALQLAIDALHGQDVPAELVDRIHNIIERRVRSLNVVVDDLLDIAKLSTGELELRAHPLKLADLIRQVVETVDPMLDGRAIDLALDDEVVVAGDAARLVRCIANVVDNAIKFTERDGRITIKLTRSAGRALLRVTDNGRGITAALLPQLFDVFSRTTRGTSGVGLGLAIVRRLVGVHGGRVRAFSEGEGRGATFEISLPLAATAAPRVEEDLRPTRSLRVVVCEDAHDIRELAADLLRADGHTVYQAADGATAIKLIETERPDVALVDLVLPDIDGFTVARTVRRTLGTSAPRMVAITALASATPQADFDEHLLKPASRERMLSVLARLSR